MKRRAPTTRLAWGAASVLALAVGSIGTWVSLGSLSAGGLAGDGVITLTAAIASGILMALRRREIVVGLLAAIALAVGIYHVQDISSAGVRGAEPSVGWGLILVVVASVSLLGWAIVSARDKAPRR